MWILLWKISNTWENLLLILLFFPPLLQGQDYLWQEDPLPGKKTQLLFASQSGLMLVGTDQGLFSYDGIEWLSISRPDSQMITPTVVYEGGDTLWVGYEDGKLCYVHQGKSYLPDWEEGFPKVAITGIDRDSSGTLWFSTYGEGVYYMVNERLYNINTDDGLLDNDVYCLEQCTSGAIWVGTDRGISICSIEEGRKSLKALTIDQGLPDYIVKSMASVSDGRMLIGMDEKGICLFDPRDSTFFVPKEISTWTGGSVNSVYSDSMRIYVGTESGGLWELKGQRLLQVHSFPTAINSLSMDQESNLWCGLEFSSIHRASTFLQRWIEIERPIQAIFEGASDRIWLGTDSGLWQFDKRSLIPRQIPLPPINILSLYEDEQQTLWVGTFGEGLWRYFPQTGHISQISEKDGLANNNILSMYGIDNEIWLATLGGVSQFQIPIGNKLPVFQNYDREEGLGTEYTYQVMKDSRGNTWIATDGKGLWLEQADNFDQVPQVSHQTIYGLTEDSLNRIWFYTDGDGLWSLDGDSLTHYNMRNGLGSVHILGISAINNGSVLLLNDIGIDWVKPNDQTVSSMVLNKLIPDWEPNLNALHQAKDGRVWMGSHQTLLAYSPLVNPQQTRPRPLLKEVSVYLDPIEEEHLAHLAYQENHISFSYTGIWYQAPNSLRYRYRMKGLDLDWQSTQNRRATYPQLTPGNYTFELQVSSTESFHNSETLSISIQVHKPFWQKAWFILLSIGSILGIIYKMVKTREKRLQQKEDFKRNQVRFQLETLQSQINPHFIFNSFNTLVSLIEEDRRHAVEYVERLSDFFRNIIELKDKNFISLKEELSLLQNYQEIQQSRYGKNFVLDLNVPSLYHQNIIPPLSLQLLVENALKHNIASDRLPLRVEIFIDQDALHIRNNLQPKRGNLPSTRLGLKNIVKRFELLGSKSIEVQDGPDFFLVMLPLIEPLPHGNSHY